MYHSCVFCNIETAVKKIRIYFLFPKASMHHGYEVWIGQICEKRIKKGEFGANIETRIETILPKEQNARLDDEQITTNGKINSKT